MLKKCKIQFFILIIFSNLSKLINYSSLTIVITYFTNAEYFARFFTFRVKTKINSKVNLKTESRIFLQL